MSEMPKRETVKEKVETPLPERSAVPIREKRVLPEECDTNIREIYEILSEIPINADEIAARTQKNRKKSRINYNKLVKLYERIK